jgi:hypothetical protein
MSSNHNKLSFYEFKRSIKKSNQVRIVPNNFFFFIIIIFLNCYYFFDFKTKFLSEKVGLAKGTEIDERFQSLEKVINLF